MSEQERAAEQRIAAMQAEVDELRMRLALLENRASGLPDMVVEAIRSALRSGKL